MDTSERRCLHCRLVGPSNSHIPRLSGVSTSSAELIFNIALLGYVLYANLGTRQLSRRRFTLPLILVAVAGEVFLHNLPSTGHDLQLEAIGAAVGLALGVHAAVVAPVRRDPRTGSLVTEAGVAFAALWSVVIGGRTAFAYAATHLFHAQIASFSVEQQPTGRPAWTAEVVLMALAMVLARLTATGLQTARLPRTPIRAA